MIKSKKEAVATRLNCSTEDLNDMTYQPGHHTGPVWTAGEDYYAATSIKRKEKPPQQRDYRKGDEPRWNWHKRPDAFIESQGWQVWVAYGSDPS